MCLVLPDRVLTGDTLLRLATGRTDLPTGDPEALYDSVFGKLLRLDDALAVYPGHNYKDVPVTRPSARRRRRTRACRSASGRRSSSRCARSASPCRITSPRRCAPIGPAARPSPSCSTRPRATIAFMSMEEVRDRIARGDRRAGRARRARARGVRGRAHSRRAPSRRAASSSCASTRCCPIRPRASSPAASSARSRPSPPRPCAAWASPAPSPSTAACSLARGGLSAGALGVGLNETIRASPVSRPAPLDGRDGHIAVELDPARVLCYCPLRDRR